MKKFTDFQCNSVRKLRFCQKKIYLAAYRIAREFAASLQDPPQRNPPSKYSVRRRHCNRSVYSLERIVSQWNFRRSPWQPATLLPVDCLRGRPYVAASRNDIQLFNNRCIARELVQARTCRYRSYATSETRASCSLLMPAVAHYTSHSWVAIVE
jgi:hypothetical protein